MTVTYKRTGADIKSQGHRYLSTGDRETEEH